MSARSRCQRSYDHRLKELVRTSGDPSLAIDLGIPASTVMGWLCNPPQQVVTLDALSIEEQELEREVLMLRQRVRKLLALLRLLVALLRISGFSLANPRVLEGRAGLIRLLPGFPGNGNSLPKIQDVDADSTEELQSALVRIFAVALETLGSSHHGISI